MEYTQLPAGFAMALARNFNALNTYCAMTEEQRQAIVDRAHSARSQEEIHRIIDSLTGNRLH